MRAFHFAILGPISPLSGPRIISDLAVNLIQIMTGEFTLGTTTHTTVALSFLIFYVSLRKMNENDRNTLTHSKLKNIRCEISLYSYSYDFTIIHYNLQMAYMLHHLQLLTWAPKYWELSTLATRKFNFTSNPKASVIWYESMRPTRSKIDFKLMDANDVRKATVIQQNVSCVLHLPAYGKYSVYFWKWNSEFNHFNIL
jgi:hypothetical protein